MPIASREYQEDPIALCNSLFVAQQETCVVVDKRTDGRLCEAVSWSKCRSKAKDPMRKMRICGQTAGLLRVHFTR
jgi:hypothetical protein